MKKIISVLCILCTIAFYTCLPTMAQLDNTSFTVMRNNVTLKSVIAAKYDGYEFVMKNHTDEKLYVKNFTIENASTPQEVYADVKRNGWGAAGLTFVYGWQYALSTLGLSLVAATVACPFFVGASIGGNIGAKMEANRFVSATLSNGYFKSKEKIKMKLFAKKGLLPQITITFAEKNGDTYLYKHSYFGSSFEYLGTQEELQKKYEEKLNEAKNKMEEAKTDLTQKNEPEPKSDKEKMQNAIKNAFENTKNNTNETDQNEQKNTEVPQPTNSQQQIPTPEAYKYNTGSTTDPYVKTKQPFEENKNFTSF